MLDFNAPEFLVVAIVALLVIGPKDLPKAMRVIGKWVGKARGVARQFRSGIDTMMRESELAEMEKQWAAENESYIWQYFIQGQLLYSSDSRLPNRFINPAPFSKFYLEIDNESPGRIGQYVGWQIVRSFMENNEVKLDQMLTMEARSLFEKSKYKPKKPQE